MSRLKLFEIDQIFENYYQEEQDELQDQELTFTEHRMQNTG